MANKKEKSPEKIPVKLAVSETSQILCSGCPPPGLSDIKAIPSNVYIKGKPVITHNAIDLNLNIKPFPICNLNALGQYKCVFNSCSTWDAKIENVTAVKNKPLTVKDTLKCDAMGGQISFHQLPDSGDSAPNIVEQAQSKINSTVNDLTQKAADLTKKAGETINAVGDTVKKAGAFTKNPGFQSAVDTASDFVDEIDYQKATLDTGVGNINIKIENAKRQIKELLTGQKQELLAEMEVVLDSEKNNQNAASEDQKKFPLNNNIFNEQTQKSVDELFKYLNQAQMATALANPRSFKIKKIESSKKEDSPQKNKETTPGNTANINIEDESIIAMPSLVTSLTNISDDYTQRAGDSFTDYEKQLKSYNKQIQLEGANDSKEALQMLLLLGDLMNSNTPDININPSSLSPGVNIPGIGQAGGIIKGAAKGAAAVKISETRTELNDIAQARINELLAELEYFERLGKYQKKSKEAQEDIDKARAALDLIGDFDAFVDGIISEEFAEVSAKAKESLTKLNNNMAQLNTGLDGASYVASGFAKGNVYTHIKAEQETTDEEESDDDSRLAAANLDTSALFDDNSAVTNDRNEEARILRMFVIWDQDYEDFKEGELVTVETIPPDTKVCLVIQANKKADGKVVSVNLGDRSLHYEYDGGHQCRVTRQGLFEDIVLNGDSPDFDNDGQYDFNDPDYAIEGGNRRQLSDTTKIKLVSVLPPEEEEEEIS